MERTRKTLKAAVEQNHHKHIKSDPHVEALAWEAYFHERPFFMLDEQLTIKYGAEQMLLFAYIRECWEHHSKNNALQEDGSFILRYQDITNSTGLSDFKIRKYKKSLIQLGWFTTIKKGIPPKEYYYMNPHKSIIERGI